MDELMAFSVFLPLTVIIALGMVSPGPDFFLVVKNALSYSRPAALMTALGIVSSLLVHMTYCVAGLAVVIEATPWLFNALRYAGATYLVWIGIQALRADGELTAPEVVREPMDVSPHRAFWEGFLCNLLNPKATLFFLALFTQFLNSTSTLLDKVSVAAIVVILALVWWPLLVLMIQHARVRQVLAHCQKRLDKVLGAVLIGFGLKIAFWF